MINSVKKTLSNDTQMRSFLRTLNSNEAIALKGEIMAELYWLKRNPQWFSGIPRKHFAALRRVGRLLARRLNTGVFPPERSANGLIIQRHNELAGIYAFQSRMERAGWTKLWGNAYQCLWEKQTTLQVCNYTEGDVVTLTASEQMQFNREKNDRLNWLIDNN
jgi:hypothetical protein